MKITMRRQDPTLLVFQATSGREITPELAKRAQDDMGYTEENGYSFESFKATKDSVLLRYTATWESTPVSF